MASLRNAVKRITHKERSQPQNRSKLGILEKKKDYKLRSHDYHLKEERLKAMRGQASMRNPDEFYFGMASAKMVDGKHRMTNEARMDRLKDEIGAEAVALMKDQDLAYVRLHRQRDVKQLKKLQSEIHFLGSNHNEENKKRKHTIFMDSEEDAKNFNAASHFQTAPELMDRAFNRPRLKDILKSAEEEEYDDEDEEDLSEKELLKKTKRSEKEMKQKKEYLHKVAKERANSYKELELRKERLNQLKIAEAHLVNEKLMRGKGKKRKVKDGENGLPDVYKWRRIRKG